MFPDVLRQLHNCIVNRHIMTLHSESAIYRVYQVMTDYGTINFKITI